MVESKFTRVFDENRKAQGFRSQQHLDAFYASHDHVTDCPVCSRIGGYVSYDDGMQPYMGQCEKGLELYRLSLTDNFGAA